MYRRKIERIPEFDRELKKLNKKHRGLTEEVENILDGLASNRMPDGDRLKGYGEHQVFKIRCGIGTIGKRKGARIIYCRDDSGLGALTIYLKSRKADVLSREIMNRLMHYLQSQSK